MANLFDQEKSSHTYTGIVEKIVYHNETSHYTVARFRKDEEESLITIVGNFSGVEEGDFLQVSGEWIVHKRFGEQFRVDFYQLITPNTEEGVMNYLSSGIVEGIGKKLAARMVEKFGVNTIQVIEEEPERLKEVSGLGQKRIDRLVQEIKSKKSEQTIQIFLRGLGLTGVTLLSVYQAYQENTMEILRQNPYILMDEISNIGFKRADKIAEKMGVPKDSPQRVKAALQYSLQRALEEGSTCLPREDAITRTQKLTGLEKEPLEIYLQEEIQNQKIIEEKKFLFLPFVYKMEVSVSNLIHLLLLGERPSFPTEVPLEERYTEEQSMAIQRVLSEKISILTGGPGVGKTYTVLGIAQILQGLGLRLALCAPTGRAAKRLQETTSFSTMTIHRLLKYQPGRGFIYNASNPLEVDSVIVDESSMIDIFLFYHLLSALPSHCRLILVGDKDQLPPVGPGNPFCDLIESGKVKTTHLSKIFRQKEGSMIIQNAHAMQRGEMPYFPQGKSDFYFFQKSDSEEILKLLEELILQKIPLQFAIPSRDIQVLAPMRRGLLGYENLNQRLQGLFNVKGETVAEVSPYLLKKGDRVMQIKNNYDKEVFNGDIGFVVGKEDSSIVVDFMDNIVYYEPKELKELTLAYAISVHKSQGSEYPCVIVPIVPQHTILLRKNLVYTAMTRGMKLVIFVGEKKSLSYAIHKNSVEKRHSLFLERLAGM